MEESSPEASAPDADRTRSASSFVALGAAVVGIALVLLRDVFASLGRPIHPFAVAFIGVTLAGLTAWKAVDALPRVLGLSKRKLRMLVSALVVTLGAILLVFPAPISPKPENRMTGGTNVAVVDFLLDGATSSVRDRASSEIAGVVEGELARDASASGIEVARYDAEEESRLDAGRRTAWAEAFASRVNAHVVVGGLMKSLGGAGTRITLLAYVRSDTIPESPELASWIESRTPIITLFDVTGATFGPAEREQLAHDVGGAVSDLVAFAQATNHLRAGRPAEAATALQRLAEHDSALVPAEEVALFRAVAQLLRAQALPGPSRAPLLEEAKGYLAPHLASFPRARFVDAEIQFQIAAAPGCATGAIDGAALAMVRQAYDGLGSEPVDPLIAAKARLGSLKARACAVAAGLLSAADETGEESAIHHDATQLYDDLGRLPATETLAVRPIAARTLAVWPEVVLARAVTRAESDEAASLLRRATELEQRPERAGIYRLELAVIEARRCDRDAAATAAQDGTALLASAVQNSRLDSTTAKRMADSVSTEVERILDDSCP